MSTKILRDRPRSVQEWQDVDLLTATVTKALYPATTYGPAVYIGDWDKLQVILDITSSATDAGDTMDAGVEMSMDGLAWYSVGDFTQQAGNGTAATELMTFIPGGRPTNIDAIIIGSTACGATVIREHLVGRYIRYKIAVADNDTNGAHAITLTASLFRTNTVRQEEDEIKDIALYPLAVYTNEDVPAVSDFWEIGDNWDFMQIVLRTTAHLTDAGDHLDICIDFSVDGVTWINAGMFTQCNGNDGPWVELMTFIPGTLPNDIDALLVVTADAGETVIRPALVGAWVRARATITESGTDDEAFTFSLHVYVK